jgi:hypothetical protein
MNDGEVQRGRELRAFIGDEKGKELSAMALSLIKAYRLSTEEIMYLSLCLDGFADIASFEEEVYAGHLEEMWRRGFFADGRRFQGSVDDA